MAEVKERARRLRRFVAGAVFQHHAGQHLFFAHLVGQGHHRRVGDPGVGEQQGLDLGGGDVFARAADDVLAAVHEMEHAIGAPAHDVAGVEPAAAPGLGRGLRVVEVAAEEVPPGRGFGVADHQLARRAVGQHLAGLVHHAGVQARACAAEGPRADLARFVAVAQGPHHLGHAPEFEQREAIARLECRVQLGLDAGAVAKAHWVRALQIAHRLV